jgi:flagellar basal-body rod protein FlgF
MSMLRGVYTLAAAMVTASEQLDVTANNLANVDTAGFKRQLLQYTSEPTMEIGRYELRGGQQLSEDLGKTSAGTLDTAVFTDYAQGSLQITNRNLDAAIGGDGFFVVNDGQRDLYTRAGNFTLSSTGALVTPQGWTVQSTGGPIEVGTRTSLTINGNGEVFGDGELLGQLRVVSFADKQQLEHVGGNAFAPKADAIPEPVLFPRIIPGALERSNANVVDEMVRLITVMRHFEAAQKVIVTTDATMDAAINKVGTVRQ